MEADTIPATNYWKYNKSEYLRLILLRLSGKGKLAVHPPSILKTKLIAQATYRALKTK